MSLVFMYNVYTLCGYDLRCIPQFDVLTRVRFVWFLHVRELKVKSLRLAHLARPSQVLHQGYELMMVPSVIVQL